MKAFAGDGLVFAAVEAVEAGGAVGGTGGKFVRWNEEIEGEEFFAEVPFVDGAAEDGFVKGLELAEGETFGQELEADRLVADFSAQSVERGAENLCVVEGEWWEFLDGMPCGFGSIGIAFGGVLVRADEGVIGDADDASAWVAVGVSVGVELFEENVVEVGFLFEFAAGGLVECFLHVYESAGECP